MDPSNASTRHDSESTVTSIEMAPPQPIVLPKRHQKVRSLDLEDQVVSIDYLPYDAFVAAGLSNGTVHILERQNCNYSIYAGTLKYLLKAADNSPVSSMSANKGTAGLSNAALLTHSSGALEYWHCTSQQQLFSKQFEKSLLCCQINAIATKYVIGGEDGLLRVGSMTKGDPEVFEAGALGSHENRIFCTRWWNGDDNLIVTGGWDRTVFTWDVRIGKAVSNVFGSYIGGKAIDTKGPLLLMGSNTPQNKLRVYDTRNERCLPIKWDLFNPENAHDPSGVLSCAFGQFYKQLSRSEGQIVACTSKRQLRVFRNGKCDGFFEDQSRGRRIYSMAVSSQSNQALLGWNDSQLMSLSY